MPWNMTYCRGSEPPERRHDPAFADDDDDDTDDDAEVERRLPSVQMLIRRNSDLLAGLERQVRRLREQ